MEGVVIDTNVFVAAVSTREAPPRASSKASAKGASG